MKSTSLCILLMITEEEICHQNNNFLDLLHPTVGGQRPGGGGPGGRGHQEQGAALGLLPGGHCLCGGAVIATYMLHIVIENSSSHVFDMLQC